MNPAEFKNIAAAEEKLWWYQGQRDILTNVIDNAAEFGGVTEVLEAGCGTGLMAQYLARRYAWRLSLLDLSELGLLHARDRGMSRLIQGNVTHLPIAAASFDAVISLDVIAHLDKGLESVAFREFARVLRPGGLLVLRTAALDSLRSRHSQFIVEKQRFTRRRLISMLEKEGFEPRFVSYANSLLLPAAWFKFRVWEPLSGAPVASGVHPVSPWLNGLLRLPLTAEAHWIKRGGSLPIGQTLVVLAKLRQ